MTRTRRASRQERLIYALLLSQSVPLPKLLKTDLSRSLLPFAYVLSERLPGTTLGTSYENLTAVQRSALYRQLGDYLGRMHTLSFSTFGDIAERRHVLATPITARRKQPFPRAFCDWLEMHRQISRAISCLQHAVPRLRASPGRLVLGTRLPAGSSRHAFSTSIWTFTAGMPGCRLRR